MKHFVIIAFGFLVLNFNAGFAQISDSKKAINVVLDSWHSAASEANFKGYFELMTADAVFIGTDAKENWNRSAFEAFAKPYFDKGKAWSFSALERHIYFDTTGNTAWFDELLSTQMKICRGSGVVVKIGNQWKIKHYVLSMTIPNENVNEVVQIKTTIEEPIIQQLRSKS
ncbi:nuclear transport factor 2 family protein [Flavobacterium sp.]|uniref:nuclear transport factor 2 family protein n=1 Tax=Flavobacterium sp. TaxID=239 RepID=UPI0035B17923